MLKYFIETCYWLQYYVKTTTMKGSCSSPRHFRFHCYQNVTQSLSACGRDLYGLNYYPQIIPMTSAVLAAV